MADAIPRRINLQAEELKHNAGVSESTLTRVGQSVNFINKKQYDSRGFFLNGPYATMGANQEGVDGAWGVLFDVEIVGIMMFNLVGGTAGTTTLDIKRITEPNGPAISIFSTTPKISYLAAGNAYLFLDVLNNVQLTSFDGLTYPVLKSTELNAGDMLVCDLLSVQTRAQNCGILIYYRPR